MRNLLELVLVVLLLQHFASPQACVAAGAERIPVADLLPESVDRGVAEKTIGRLLKHNAKLVEVPPSLIETLRWGPHPNARQSCLAVKAAVDQHLMAKTGNLILSSDAALLKLAEEEVSQAYPESALDTLYLLRHWIPCLTKVMTREQLILLYKLEAIANVYTSDARADAAFARLLDIDPSFEPTGYGPRVKEPFEQVQREQRPDVPGGRLVFDSFPATAYVDGRQAAHGQPIVAGEHLIQLETAWGEVRGALVSVKASAPDAPQPLLSLYDFGLLSPEQGLAGLKSSLANEKPDVFQQRALNDHFAQTGAKELLFAMAAGVGGGVRVSRVIPGVTVIFVCPPEPGGGQKCGPPPPPPTSAKLQITLGGAGLYTIWPSGAAQAGQAHAGFSASADKALGDFRVGLVGQFLPIADSGVTDCGAIAFRQRFSLGAAAWYPQSLLGNLVISPGVSLGASLYGCSPAQKGTGKLPLVSTFRTRLTFLSPTFPVGASLEVFAGTGLVLFDTKGKSFSLDPHFVTFPLGATFSTAIQF